MRTTNALLDEAARSFPPSSALPSESVLARRFDVSRTVIRSALVRLESLGLVGQDGRGYVMRRQPRATDFYDNGDIESRADLVERRFMELALGGELQPGARFSEAELARRAGVSTVSVREFLISFARYGVVQKEARGGWRLGAFDRAFGQELASMRRMFELDAIRQFANAGPDDPAWPQIASFLRRHAAVRDTHAEEPRLFSELDREFHRFLVGRLRNRFADSFYDIISFVFHYHYQWDKRDEIARNAAALVEHEAILHALADGDFEEAERRLRRHLDTAVRTLLAATAARDDAAGSG